MASQFYGHAGFAFVSWKPAKEQLREMLERKGLRVNTIIDLPVSFGGTRLEAYIETPGLNLSDLIASLENSRAGVNISVSFYSGSPDEHPESIKHNFAPRINQKVIDLFRAVFGPEFWAVVTRAGLAYMADSPTQRSAPYAGPDVEDLTGLSTDERARLITAITS